MLFGFEEPASTTDAEPAIEAVEQAAPESSSPIAGWLLAVAGLLVGLAIGLGAWLLWPSDPGLSAEDVEEAIAAALSDQAAETISPATLAYNAIAPSLVIVETIEGSNSEGSLGAGVVINDRGDVLTANHVIDEAASITVTLASGDTGFASVINSDPELDIAVLSVSGTTAGTPAVIGNSRTLQIGDPVFAVGNPLGLSGSISAGVVSGLSRSLALPDSTDEDVETTGGEEEAEQQLLVDLIQFDAAVNRGSSGGPLLNSAGQVIGIVTALADPSGQGQFTGISFAVPIDIAAGRAADGPSQ